MYFGLFDEVKLDPEPEDLTIAPYLSCDNCGFEFIVLDKFYKHVTIDIERCPKCGASKACLHEGE